MIELLIRIGVATIVSLAAYLPIAISLHIERKRFDHEAENGFYVLRQPKFVLGLGIVSTLLFSVAFIFAVVISDEWIGFFFLPFCALGTFLALYAIRWKIIVDGSSIEIHQLGKHSLKLDIRDIERVAQEYNGMIAYRGGKKIFSVETWVVGSELLYTRLHEFGKMESTQNRNSFAVRRSKAEPVIGVLCIVFFLGCIILAFSSSNDTATPFVYVVFIGFILLGIYLVIASLRWKMKVVDDQLVYRTPLGHEKTVPVKSIERIKVNKNTLSLLCDGKTIIKVEKVYKEYATLVERLQAENIPFYDKDKLIAFDL